MKRATRGPAMIITRFRQGATKLGISLQDYEIRYKAGLRWCSGHKIWEPENRFGKHARRVSGVNSICRVWDRMVSVERQARYRAERRKR